MQYSWQFHYFSTLINLGTDNMFSLVSLHLLLFVSFFLHIVFVFLQLVFSHFLSASQRLGKSVFGVSERGCPGLFCLQNMLLGNYVVSTIVLREVSSIMDVVIETQ